MIDGATQQHFAHAQAVAAFDRERVGQQRVRAAVEAVVAGQHSAARVEQCEHRVGLGAESLGGDIEHQSLARLRVEVELVHGAAFVVHAPEGGRQRFDSMNPVRAGQINLRQIVHVQFDSGALAVRADRRKLVSAAGQIVRRRHDDPNFTGSGFNIFRQFRLDSGVV